MMLLFLLCLTLAIMVIDGLLSIALKVRAARHLARPQLPAPPLTPDQADEITRLLTLARDEPARPSR